MHPFLDRAHSLDAESAGLRQRLRLALAGDLNLPASHPDVVATMDTFRAVAHRHATVASTPGAAAQTTLHLWWASVAHPHALIAR